MAPKKKDAPLANRFYLLNMDGSENGSLEDDELESNGINLSGVKTSTLLIT